MKPTSKKYPAPGFTLVEIMISMVIALIVMGGVYRTLQDESVNQERSTQILDMQNNARTALDRLVRDIRRAGFLGCDGETTISTLSNSVTTSTNFIQQFTLAPSLPSVNNWNGLEAILSKIVDTPVADVNYLGEAMGFSNNAPAGHDLYEEGSDAITLVYLSDERSLDPADPMTSTADPTIALTAKGFDSKDILYITDCSNSALFQKTNANGNTIQHAVAVGFLNNTTDLGKAFGVTIPAKVFKLNTATYFLNKGTYELCLNSKNRQVASNIEDLQFEFMFDEDTDGSLDDEVWATSLGAHSADEVKMVRIWLLAMSEPDYSYTDNNTYDYPNSPYKANSPAALAPIADPPDGEYRHRFLASATVKVRNG